jgi:hypothetical protein
MAQQTMMFLNLTIVQIPWKLLNFWQLPFTLQFDSGEDEMVDRAVRSRRWASRYCTAHSSTGRLTVDLRLRLKIKPDLPLVERINKNKLESSERNYNDLDQFFSHIMNHRCYYAEVTSQ